MKSSLYLFTMTVLFSCGTSSDVRTEFKQHEILPDILKVAPNKIVQVSYPSGVSVNLGNELTPTLVKDKPQVTWDADASAYYTLLMVDPDIPSRSVAKSVFGRIEKAFNKQYREMRHWTVMNIPGDSIENGEEIAEYIGAAPLQRTGFHRFVFLVYRQPNGIILHKEPHTRNRSISNRALTSASRFAQKYNLGEAEFGNFFQAEWDEYCDKLMKEIFGFGNKSN